MSLEECRKIEIEANVLFNDALSSIYKFAKDRIIKELKHMAKNNPRTFVYDDSKDDLDVEIEKLEDHFYSEIDVKALMEIDPFVDEFKKIIDTYKGMCTLPSEEKLYEEASDQVEDAIYNLIEPYVMAYTTELLFNGKNYEGNYRLEEIPSFIFTFMRNKRMIKNLLNIEVPMTFDKVDLRNNNITNMRRLKEIDARVILIEGNPIEKIEFSDETQFLNVIFLNDLSETRLPSHIKEGIKECSQCLCNYFKDIDIDESFSISSEDSKKIFEQCKMCRRIYDELQSTNS